MNDFRAQASSATRLPPIGVDPSTPDGLAKIVAIGAAECLKGARDLDAGFSDLTGEFILVFHAIELGLKAFLIKRGLSESELSRNPFRHNLINLYKESKRRGLTLDINDTNEMISWINEWHCDGVRIRYTFDEQRTLPMCATIIPLAEAIISAVEKNESAAR